MNALLTVLLYGEQCEEDDDDDGSMHVNVRKHIKAASGSAD